MSSFYGNIKNNSRASFIFDKIYSSRSAMDKALEKKDSAGVIIGDGVFVNRYVLVDYNYYISDDNSIEIVDRYGKNTLLETTGYSKNRADDIEKYGTSFDKTVWMKIYIDNEEKYILIGELNAKAPMFELITDAPSEYNGAPHIDLIHSGELSYAYHAPKSWDVILNNYNPREIETYTNDSNQYYYYEQDDDVKSFSTTTKYPFYNEDGFSPIFHNISNINEEGISLKETKSALIYPKDTYTEIGLTLSTYIPNHYYIKNNDNYEKALGPFDSNETYYTLTQECINDEFQTIHKNDTKRLDIYLPSIGNSVAKLYDSLYGTPSNHNGDYLIGYTTDSIANSYQPGTSNNCKIKIKNNNNEIESREVYLSDDDIDKLYHDNIPPHTIPVYDLTEKHRPYTEKQIFDYINIEPYKNLNTDDPISMGWALDLMKKYISELRFLAQGIGIIGYTNSIEGYEQNNYGLYRINDILYNLTDDQTKNLHLIRDEEYNIPVYKTRGLQSDWALNDSTAFGYIHNRPWVVNSTAITAIWEATTIDYSFTDTNVGQE